MNGPRIRIRWIFLSNFHIENIFIRGTVYFYEFFKIKVFSEIININRKGIMTSAGCQHDISRSTDPLTGQTDQWVPPVIDSGLT